MSHEASAVDPIRYNVAIGICILLASRIERYNVAIGICILLASRIDTLGPSNPTKKLAYHMLCGGARAKGHITCGKSWPTRCSWTC